jgi:hypothetical protein
LSLRSAATHRVPASRAQIFAALIASSIRTANCSRQS